LDPALIFFLCFIAFVQKITFFLGKSTKTVATRAALFDSGRYTKSFARWGFAADVSAAVVTGTQ